MKQAKILIADDEAAGREALAEMLGRWGHVVTEANDGNEALKKAIEAPPDVIVSDLVMPTLNGLSLLRALREELPEVPVILLTGKGTIDSAVAAIRQGAYDFLEKPVEGQRLRMVVERALEKKATMQVVAAGERAADLSVRLLYAGAEHTTIPDPMAAIDLPNLARETGDIIERQGDADGAVIFHIRKAA